ncbi:LysR family transcriptional regulator [Pusillimonas sp. TS35]|uniref:LysR family transcriptional regulator n=1 Tax=Paracandidimonas lactea TaxID=2895524 RepID=UPI0013704CF6|nr:LysR family transcriptional regulator [Paracandidimonas lactea]MYN11815.1 LysR family transcriptional regulator [Pusillimonas sp. TS35]
MNRRRLQCFIAVFEKGSVSAAAEALHMTQPPLSVLIRKLEQELGVTLFDREANRLVPTQTGELFYLRAKELLTTMSAIQRELGEVHAGARGTVRVGCSTAASLFLIPDVMTQLARDALDINVRVQEGETATLMQRLRDGALDFAICRSFYAASDLDTRILTDEPLCVALPHGHPLAGCSGIRIGDLREEKFLMHTTPPGRGIADSLIAACQVAGYTPDVIYWGVETLPMLLMVQRGMGVAFAPASFRQLGLAGMPILVPLVDPGINTQLTLITLKNNRLPISAQRFISLLGAP